MARFKTQTLLRSTIISITGAGMYDSSGIVIGPVQKGGASNCLINGTSGEYDGGDRVVGFQSYDIDEDILITTGWGDGCAVRRLNNDGSMTKLYHDNYALWRDTTLTYNHMHNVAMAKGCNKAVIMSHNVYGYSIIDYQGAVDGVTNGGAVIRVDRPTHANPTDFIDPSGTNSRANNDYVRRAGNSYVNGLCAAGEWIYASEYDAMHYKQFPRRNLATGEQEFLDGAGTGSDKYSGSADNDRNGYRGALTYDEVNDRMYYWDYEGNGSFTVILDASTSTPKTLWCDLEDTVAGTNSAHTVNGYSRETGLFVPNPSSAPNVIIAPGYDYFLELDYTNCFTGGAPYVTRKTYLLNFTEGIDFNALSRFGTKYQKESGTPMDKMPGYANSWVPLSGDRGFGKVDGGFLDLSTFKVYSRKNLDSYTEDTSTVYGPSARGRSFQSNYGTNPVLMSSANGSKYWIRMGYDNDGHSFRIWSESTNPIQLSGNWEVVFGTYTLPNSATCDTCFITGTDGFTVPSNCSLNIYVSNNNGSTYETYDTTSTLSHVFSTTGTQLRVKISATGHPNKSPFLCGIAPLTVNFESLHDAAKNSAIKYKISRKRLN
jgi:hypothetical protein